MSNPFRTADKAKQFDSLVLAYQQQASFLFQADGNCRRNNSFAAHFWAGFEGINGGLFRASDPAYRRTLAYVLYRAGQECAQQEAAA